MESSLNMNLETRARDHNRFALALFETLGRAPNNLFISPYAIDMLLAMVYAGARGTTAQQMAKALQFTQDQQSLHATLSQIQARLQSVQEKGHITSTSLISSGRSRIPLSWLHILTSFEINMESRLPHWITSVPRKRAKPLMPGSMKKQITRYMRSSRWAVLTQAPG